MENIGHRIVHFDLKGAPWRVPYLTQVISVAKQWGATGILFEWEDTFPYTGELAVVGSLGGCSREGLYSYEDIKYLLNYTKEIGLEPIQLVQSIGHLEFVLKHEKYAAFRENQCATDVLCPSRIGARQLVVDMIKQVLEMQPDAKFIHIGADEAWYMNECEECRGRSSASPHGQGVLFVQHVQHVVLAVHEAFPDVRVTCWDDMMRTIDPALLSAYAMYKYVLPVVWHYAAAESFALDAALWRKYDECFPELWAASAYKGANGSSQMVSPVARYVSNQEAWINQIKSLQGGRITFTGVIITGWSRYDHYATLCELLPVSLPSLASCLKMWTKPDHVPKESVQSESLPEEQWPARECALLVRQLHDARASATNMDDTVATWMNTWQVDHEYTNPLRLHLIANNANNLQNLVHSLQRSIYAALLALTGPRSAEEFTLTHAAPLCAALRLTARTAALRATRPASTVPRPDKFNPDS